MNLKPLHFVSP